MAVPVWQPGTLYAPGSIVQPSSVPAPIQMPVQNPSFESATPLQFWTAAGPGTWEAIVASTVSETAYSGTKVARYLGAPGTLTSTTVAPVTPGQSIRATAFVKIVGVKRPDAYGSVAIEWLDSLNAVLSVSESPWVIGSTNPSAPSVWIEASTGNVQAPANAAFARVKLFADSAAPLTGVFFDLVSWNYVQQQAPVALLFTAIQANTGLSGVSEPAWPNTAGDTVTDNEVEWEAVTTLFDTVVWEANPILVSGATEPTWPEANGGRVLDNTISWEATTRRITDERCPHTKVVAIAASKIFAADDDIIAFCATVNPLNWSEPEDAGYIPFGLQTYGATPVSGMGLYRSNLVAFNSKGYQMWQVDEDPLNMAILDAAPVGSSYPKSIHPVSNDLVFLTDQGIRNIGIAGASTNLQAGFFGKQVDPIVLDLIREAQDIGLAPRALFWPAAGQYWLFFGAEAIVLTMNGGKDDMHWSRYTFPADVSDWTIQGDDLILRAGDKVWVVTDEARTDDEDAYGLNGVPFDGLMSWPYLDMGMLGREKMLHGFDLVIDGTVQVSFGYDQRNFDLATEPYEIEGDTLTGQVVPMPLSGPSFQLRLAFPAGQAEPWEWQAASLYLDDMRGGT
jgi:hypothetical protein